MRWTDSTRTIVLIVALAGQVSAQPAPFAPLPILDVPYISQTEALCGGAAAAMVLRYWGERGLTADSFSHLVDRSAAGIRTDALLTEIRSRGWTAVPLDGSDAAIDAELQRSRPILTLIEDRPGRYHYIVIVAATRDAVVFHDPARAPLRVVGRAEFSRRWEPAGRWMAVVVPGERERSATSAPAVVESGNQGSCDRLIAAGVSQAQAGDLAGAERSFTAALSCGGAAAMRELAGVRVLQQRWADVESLSAAATAMDPAEPYGWRLLGTSRFVQNDRTGALKAWNQIGEPRLDLVNVAGLARTRQRVVEQLIDAKPSLVVTPDLLLRSERRLRELPAAQSASVDVTPRPGGLAEMRAAVNERPVLPSDIWSYAGIGIAAASRREVRLTTGSLTGGGERLLAEWRFWPGRPRIGLSFDAPARWGGVWGVHAFAERERFTDISLSSAERAGGFARWSQWITPVAELSIDAGVEDWDDAGTLGRSRLGMRILTRDARLDLRGGGEAWWGSTAFSRADVAATAVTSRDRQGLVFVARAGAGVGSADLPPLLWFAGDTGQARDILLRAHPLVDDGRLRVEQMGKRLLHASIEGQHWWTAGLLRVGGATFVDATRTDGRLDYGLRGDVDAGVGLRLALPGIAGVMRADVATGLRHGGTRWSFVYEPGD